MIEHTAYIQLISNLINPEITEPINGSWLSSVAGGEIPVNTPDIWLYICQTNDWEIINGDCIQTIANNIGIEEPVNGSWLQGIYNYLVRQN